MLRKHPPPKPQTPPHPTPNPPMEIMFSCQRPHSKTLSVRIHKWPINSTFNFNPQFLFCKEMFLLKIQPKICKTDSLIAIHFGNVKYGDGGVFINLKRKNEPIGLFVLNPKLSDLAILCKFGLNKLRKKCCP